MAEMSLSEFNERQKVKPGKQGVTIPPRAGLAVLAVILLAASFGAGMQYEKGKNHTVSTTQAASSQQGGGTNSRFNGGAGGFSRGNRAIGTVSAVSSSSITITTRGGTSSTYAITSSTTVTNSGQTGSVSDIQSGDTVFITLDTSNTQDAASIALNPSFGGAPSAGTTPSSSSDSTPTDGTSTTTLST